MAPKHPITRRSRSRKFPLSPRDLSVKALAAPFTVNTMPDKTLMAFADCGTLGDIMAADGGDSDKHLAAFASAGIDLEALASRLQDEGAKSFVESWTELMGVIGSKADCLKQAN